MTRRSPRSRRPPTSTRSRQARLAHAGDRSPLALANREIGALPPQAKAEAGKRVGEARQAVRAALEARQTELEAERDDRVLVEEAVDVTLPLRPAAPRRAPPAHHADGAHRRGLRGDGLRGRRGPRGRGRVAQLRRPQHAARPPGPHRCRTPSSSSRPDSGMVLRTHTSPVQIRTMLDAAAADLRDLPRAGSSAPTSSTPRTRRCSHQVEGLVVDEGITMADLKGTLDHFAAAMFGEGLVTRLRPSYFPFTEPSAEVDLQCFVCRGTSVGDPDTPAAPAPARAGSSGAAAAWSTRGCSSPAASTRSATAASRSAWASSAR